MPKGRSWKKAERDATRARNKAMVASRHRHDPIAPLALADAEDNLKYKGVVMINEDRLTVMEKEVKEFILLISFYKLFVCMKKM